RKTSCTKGLGSSSSTSFTVGMVHSPFLIASVHDLLGLAVLGGHSVPSFYSPARKLTPGASPPTGEPADLGGATDENTATWQRIRQVRCGRSRHGRLGPGHRWWYGTAGRQPGVLPGAQAGSVVPGERPPAVAVRGADQQGRQHGRTTRLV